MNTMHSTQQLQDCESNQFYHQTAIAPKLAMLDSRTASRMAPQAEQLHTLQ